VFGSGVARAGTKVLAANTGFRTVLAIPGVGRIQANCGSGSTAAVRIVNTGKAMLFLWLQVGTSTSGASLPSHATSAPSRSAISRSPS
jgi:hypothetical protein